MYYELQIPTMIRYKEVFGDIESFHIFGICALNEHLHAKKVTEHDMHRDEFLNSFFSSENSQGINAMSISDITGIPRATVIRKLKNLVKQKKLRIDIKKHYKLTMSFAKILKPIQRNTLVKLANFSAKVYNLELIERKN